jgi:LEA14-like dessication related protein
MTTKTSRSFLAMPLLCAYLLSLPGCAVLSRLLGAQPQPKVTVSGVRIADLSLTDLTVVFDLTITNPYAVPLPLVNLDYALASGAQPFLQGQAAMQGTVPVSGSKTVSVPTKVVFLELLKVLQGVQPGALVPYRATLGLSVDAPVLGRLRLPIDHDGQFPVPAVPDVSVPSITWQSVSLAGVAGVLKLRIANPNAFAFDLAGMSYDIKLGSFSLVKGGLTNAASLAAGGSQEIAINVAVSTAQAGLAIVQMLQGKGSGYSLGGALSLSTPFGPLSIPLANSGQVPFLR